MRVIAAKIPGCTPHDSTAADPGGGLTRQDVSCTDTNGDSVQIVTFTSMAKERQWISAGPSTLEGHLWAAVIEGAPSNSVCSGADIQDPTCGLGKVLGGHLTS